MKAGDLLKMFEQRGFHCAERAGFFSAEEVFLVSLPPADDEGVKVMERGVFIGQRDGKWFVRLTPHGAAHSGKVCSSADEAVQLVLSYLEDGADPGWPPLVDVETEQISFMLEDSFFIKERGWILTPAAPVDAFANNAPLTVTVKTPDGSTLTLEGKFLLEHLRLVDGGSRWHGVVVLGPDEEKIPVGSRITCSRRS